MSVAPAYKPATPAADDAASRLRAGVSWEVRPPSLLLRLPTSSRPLAANAHARPLPHPFSSLVLSFSFSLSLSFEQAFRSAKIISEAEFTLIRQYDKQELSVQNGLLERVRPPHKKHQERRKKISPSDPSRLLPPPPASCLLSPVVSCLCCSRMATGSCTCFSRS